MVAAQRSVLALLLLTMCVHEPQTAAPKTPQAASPSPSPDTTWPAASEVLAIDLRMDPGDWDALRQQGRTLNELYSGCRDPSFHYASVPAELKLGARALGRVSVRKKGLLGSLSANKPSLRIALAAYQPELRLFGSKTLVLNNSRQDPSFTHQCMAYAAFAAAGVPAPRCGFARVMVNGQDLGSYVLVEAIKKPFLRRVFGDDRGALYEGSGGADFRADQLAAFEDESDAAGAGKSLLQQLTEALSEPASEAQQRRIEQLVDLPAFMRFWALETLIAHWDGYTGDLNNFYVFVPRTTGKLVFIPWGTDGAYTRRHAYLPERGRPQSVYAVARLPERLYERAPTRELYRDTLRALLNEHWDESALLHEVERIAALAPEASATALEAQRSFLRNRRSELQAELAGEAPPWPYPEPPRKVCRPDANTALTGSFDVAWHAGRNAQPGPNNALDIQLDGQRHTYSGILARAGFADESQGGGPCLRLLAPQSDGTYVVVQVYLGARPLVPGPLPLHGMETYGVVVRAPNAEHYTMKGFVGAGTITFDEVGTKEGDRLRGRIAAQLVSLSPELAWVMSKP